MLDSVGSGSIAGAEALTTERVANAGADLYLEGFMSCSLNDRLHNDNGSPRARGQTSPQHAQRTLYTKNHQDRGATHTRARRRTLSESVLEEPRTRHDEGPKGTRLSPHTTHARTRHAHTIVYTTRAEKGARASER